MSRKINTNELDPEKEERTNRIADKWAVILGNDNIESSKEVKELNNGEDLFAVLSYKVEFEKNEGVSVSEFVNNVFKNNEYLATKNDFSDRIINEALETAVLQENNEVIDILIEKGADPNKALETAVVKGKVNALAKLIEEGADINKAQEIADREGSSKLESVIKKAQTKAKKPEVKEETQPEVKKETQSKVRHRRLSKRFKSLLSKYEGNKLKKSIMDLTRNSLQAIKYEKVFLKMGKFSKWNKNKSKELHKKNDGLNKNK